jgi:hypothetical protein
MAFPRRQPVSATHKECAHFSDGFCALNGVAVGPDQPACPNFTPKSMMPVPQMAKAYPQSGQLLQGSVPFRQSFPVAPNHPQNYYYTVPLHRGQSYLTLQRGYGIPRQSNTGVYSMGRMGGFAAGPGGSCVCPSCGYTAPHRLGSPCFQQACPKCGTPMTRKR